MAQSVLAAFPEWKACGFSNSIEGTQPPEDLLREMEHGTEDGLALMLWSGNKEKPFATSLCHISSSF